jgi:predicted transcriptional regulator
MDKETKATKSFTARLTVDTLEVLQRLANEDDRSLAYMIQKAVDEFVEHHGGKSKKK